MIAPYAGGGGVTEAFFTSLLVVEREGLTPLAIVDAEAAFMARAEGVAETHTVPGLARRGTLNGWLAGHRLGTLLRRLEPDLVLAHNGRFVAALTRDRDRPPVIGVVHSGRPGRFLRADHLVTVNAPQRRDLIARGYPAERVVQIGNALPVTRLPPPRRRPRRTPPAIGTLCQLEPAKGVDVLLDAAAALARDGVAFTLHVGGAGSRMAALRRQARALAIADRVRFHGWITDQRAFLEALDLYVMPSRHESFGIALLEAQAAGLPVIASRCPGPLAVIEEGVTGLLVEPGDGAGLAAALRRLLDDRGLGAALARAGYDRCAERFTLPGIVGAYGEVFARTMAPGGAVVRPGTAGIHPTRNSTGAAERATASGRRPVSPSA